MSFIGRVVNVVTADGKVNGRVSKIEQGKLSIDTDAGLKVIDAATIRDLTVAPETTPEPEVKEKKEPTAPAAKESPHPRPQSSRTPESMAQTPKGSRSRTSPRPSRSPSSSSNSSNTTRGSNRNSNAQPTSGANAVPLGKSRGSPAPATTANRKRSTKPANNSGPWSQTQSGADEFDFAENLKHFDKAKVFAELKLHDSTDDSVRLVAHNLKQPHQQSSSTKTKYGHNEMVVSTATASALQIVQIESYLLGSGWPLSILSETAAHGIAQAALTTLGGLNVTESHPLVVALIGNSARTGSRVVAAARILATRGCKVVLVVLPDSARLLEADLGPFRLAGGHVAGTRKQLLQAVEENGGRIELVIDGIQGIESPTLAESVRQNEDLVKALSYLVSWANDLPESPHRLSIDRPTDNFKSSVVVSCGWPLDNIKTPEGCRRYVADEGVPPTVLDTLGLAQLKIEYGASNLRNW